MQQVIREDIGVICDEELPWERLQNKKMLVTGASGFLGAYIVYSLLECNREHQTNITVYALCRNEEKANIKFNEERDNARLKILFQNVCEEISDEYRSDIIIHAASPANPYIIHQQPYEVIKANVIAYNNILEKAKKWNTEEIVLFSSSAVYGYSTPDCGADEHYRDSIDFTNDKDVYCLSKQMSEMMTVCFQKTYKIPVKVIRPFVVYGPDDDLLSHKGMIDFLNDCLSNRNIILKSKGDAVRTYVYVSDAIRAFFYILLKGKSDAYNISSDNVYSIRELAEIFCECNKNISIEYKIDNAEYLKNRSKVMIGKNEKLKELGWTEKVNMREGIMRMISWGKENIR